MGCQQSKQQDVNIRFEVKNFELKYEKHNSSFLATESYAGKGNILAVGDPIKMKKPYLVLLKINRIKGGLETDTDKERKIYVLVDEGIGEVLTFDYHQLYGEEKKKLFEKPEYKIEVLGYMPFITQKAQ
jgi:hypothetical protein